MSFVSVVTLSACKEKTFTVTFNRGEIEGRIVTIMEGYETVPETQTVSHYSEIKFPVYISDGWTFSGWDHVISKINSDTVITAYWTRHPFVVKFNAVNPDAKLISDKNLLEQTVHSWADVVEPKFELEGYDLKWEWNDSETKDTTVYAKWIPKEYELNFVDENGTPYDFEPVKVTYGEQVGKLPEPKKENLRFGGWQLEGDPSKYIFEGIVWRNANNATLISRWLEKDQHKITYIDAFDIIGANAYRSTDEDFIINPPTRYGYDFLGWTGTGIGDEPKKDLIIVKGTAGNLEFTAHWKAKGRTFILDADGGQLSQTQKTVVYGQRIGTLPTNVIKDGYEFAGWETLNGVMVDANTVWSWDPDEVNFLKAVYRRIYTIKLVLKCPSSRVICDISGSAESEFGLEKSETEENVWVFKSTFKEGDRIGDLPDEKGVSFKDSDYSFSHWATSTGIPVNPSDIINEKKFPRTREKGEIYIYVKLSSNWTPFY